MNKSQRITHKVRVNVTIDHTILKKARKKLHLFGGKLSSLFEAYLEDFVSSMDASPTGKHDELHDRLKALEKRIEKLERAPC
jgi:regulator of PEP synthase PpsR (kinase-PPPase family)